MQVVSDIAFSSFVILVTWTMGS